MQYLLALLKQNARTNVKYHVIRCILSVQKGVHLQKAVHTVLQSVKRAYVQNSAKNDTSLYASMQQKTAIITEMSYGYFRYAIRLEAIMRILIPSQKKLPSALLLLLQVALYEILYMDQLYALHEIVECVKRRYGIALGRLANAVLRRSLREAAILRSIDFIQENGKALYEQFCTGRTQNSAVLAKKQGCVALGQDTVSYDDFCCALQYSMPCMLWQVLRKNAKTKREAVKNAAQLLERPIVTRRPPVQQDVLLLREVRKAREKRKIAHHLVQCLEVDKIGLLCDAVEGVYRTSDITVTPLRRYKLYEQYNPATEELYRFLRVEQFLRSKAVVWDMCSGRGGKTSALVYRGIKVYGVSDIFFKRLACNMYRKGTYCVCMDATNPAIKKDALYGVILDVPCSGSGTIRKRPDIRTRITNDAVRELVLLQRDILHAVVNTIMPGGYIVYSTCSILYEENRGQIEIFLRQYKEFSLIREYITQQSNYSNDILYGAVLQRRAE